MHDLKVQVLSPRGQPEGSAITDEDFQFLIDNRKDKYLMHLLRFGAINDNISIKLYCNLALFMIRDEPDMRLSEIIKSAYSLDQSESSTACVMIREYIVSSKYEEYYHYHSTQGDAHLRIPLERDTDEHYISLLINAVTENENECLAGC
jgi:hypothetical protein